MKKIIHLVDWVYTLMFSLSGEQTTHFNKLLACLNEHTIAYDTSATGSGKTIVAAKIAREMMPKRAIVIGAPILKENWTRVFTLEKIPFVFKSSFGKIALDDLFKSFVIVDECQLLKNRCERTIRITELLIQSRTHILMLSATPFDHPRHAPLVDHFLNRVSRHLDFNTVRFGMDFQYPTHISYELYYTQQGEDEIKRYKRGYRSIWCANMVEDGHASFAPGIFNAGLRDIHNSLFSSLVRFFLENYTLHPTRKFIIVLKFADHFEQFRRKFQGALEINGRVPMHLRAAIIDRFQCDETARVLVITDVIGGVGIDLDDQVGHLPRHIITMPLFAADFVQLAGRVRRRNSRSNSIITVIQPAFKHTYFKGQMDRKMQILTTFNNSLEFIHARKDRVEHLAVCGERHAAISSKTSPEMANLIAAFLCECCTLN